MIGPITLGAFNKPRTLPNENTATAVGSDSTAAVAATTFSLGILRDMGNNPYKNCKFVQPRSQCCVNRSEAKLSTDVREA